MKTQTFTPAARSLFDGLSPLQQEILISMARHVTGRYKGAGRQFYTDEQWAARRNSMAKERRDKVRRDRDFAYGVHAGHANPYESKAPRGWKLRGPRARISHPGAVFARN